MSMLLRSRVRRSFAAILPSRRAYAGSATASTRVHHLAGRVTDWGTKRQFYTAIYDATENLIKEAAGRASRFVYISSIAAMGMGRHQKGIKETDPTRKSGIPYND